MRLRNILSYIGAFGLTLLGLWLLLFLSALIPNAAIQENMERSALSYAQREAYEFTRGDNLNSVADHYADAIWLNVAWNLGVGDPLTASMQTGYYDGEDLGESVGLYLTVAEGVEPNVDYTRYWHGTAMLLRLLSLVTDVQGIKTIGFVVLLALLALDLALLVKLRQPVLAALLVLSLAAVQFWNLRLSVEYQPAFLLAFALLPLWLQLERRGDRPLVLLSIVSGVAVAFFDFLTTETVTILLPLVLVLAIRAREGRLDAGRQAFAMPLRCALGWGCAYVGTFLAKWTAVTLMTGHNAFTTALVSVEERLGGEIVNFAEQPDSFLSAPLANLTMLFGGGLRVDYGRLLLGLGLCAVVLLSLWYLLRGKRRPGGALLLAVGAVVLVRYLVLNNHAYLHCFFTYRALVSLILAALAAVWLQCGRSRRKKGGRR